MSLRDGLILCTYNFFAKIHTNIHVGSCSDELLKEQSRVMTGIDDTPPHELPAFTYDTLKECTLLENVMKETLRLHAPIHTVCFFFLLIPTNTITKDFFFFFL
jgi:cytochrome P450